MKSYDDMKSEIIDFMKKSNISSFDVVRIAKDLCTCKRCKFFIQHYDAKGNELCCGHCIHGNRVKHRNPHDSSCGSWEHKKEDRE